MNRTQKRLLWAACVVLLVAAINTMVSGSDPYEANPWLAFALFMASASCGFLASRSPRGAE